MQHCYRSKGLVTTSICSASSLTYTNTETNYLTCISAGCWSSLSLGRLREWREYERNTEVSKGLGSLLLYYWHSKFKKIIWRQTNTFSFVRHKHIKADFFINYKNGFPTWAPKVSGRYSETLLCWYTKMVLGVLVTESARPGWVFFYLCVSRQQQTTTIITSSGKEASDVLISKQHLAQLSKQWVRAKGASHVHRKEGRGGYPHLNKCEKWDIISSDTSSQTTSDTNAQFLYACVYYHLCLCR